jgi:hypothetical protein
MNKLAKLIDKPIRDVSIHDINSLWEGTVDELLSAWQEELYEEIADAMHDIDYDPDNNNEYGLDGGVTYVKGNVKCVVYVSRPELYNYEDCSYEMKASISREHESTTHSFEVEATTITELMFRIDIHTEILEKDQEE